ncbi:MAG: tetratricopeptide repeat protein [Pyrinomonadaceae bacterium]|nr:tetratricopeptide repeat protein [Pyrinomonadaceae bacterium]
MFSRSILIKAVPASRALARFLPLILLVLLSCSSLAHAQAGVGSTRDIAGGTGGSNAIKGRVYAPSGRAPGARLRVQLESSERGTMTTMTEDDGSFNFGGLLAGSYTIVIDAGKEYEVLREPVYIDRGNNGRSFTVPVYLKPKGSAGGGGADASNPAFAGVPKAAVDLYMKAVESSNKNDNKKAVEQLNEAIALHPNFALALNELGIQYLKMGQPDKAVEPLQKAVKIAPTEFFPHLNYGIALLNKKSFAEAETELRAALKINNDAPTAHMYLGVALLTLSRDAKTNQYDMAKYSEAQKELEAAAASGKPEVAMAHKYLGGIYMGNKEYKRAADELEIYLKLTPKAPDAEKLKGIVKDLRSKQ